MINHYNYFKMMSREIIIQTNNATICTTFSTISSVKLFTDNIRPETNVIYLNIDSLVVDGILNNVRQGLNAFTNYENYDFTMCANNNCVLINIGGRKFYLPKSLLLDFDFFSEILSETEFDYGQNMIDRSPYVFDKIIDLIENDDITNAKNLPQDIVIDLRFYRYKKIIGKLFIDSNFSYLKINGNIYDATLGCDYDIDEYEDNIEDGNLENYDIFTNNSVSEDPTHCVLWFDKYMWKLDIESIAEKIKLNDTPLSEYYSHSLEKFDPICVCPDSIEPYYTTIDSNGHTIIYFLFPNVFNPLIYIPKNVGIINHKLVYKEWYRPSVIKEIYTKHFPKTSIVEIDLNDVLKTIEKNFYAKILLITELYIYSGGVNYTYTEIINNGQIVCRSTLSKCQDSYTINLFSQTNCYVTYGISKHDNSKLILYSDKEIEHNITLKFKSPY
nr:BTB/POZ domain protein [Megavirus caiporensis]